MLRAMATKSPEVKRLPKNRVECTVVFSQEDRAAAEERALQSLGANVKLKGFRPGKAPADVLRESVKPDELLEETVRELLPKTFQRLTAEHNITPIIPPHVQAVQHDPLTVTITFVEKPAVKFKGIEKIKVEKKEPSVGEKDVDQTVDYLLGKYRTFATVDRPAKEGDQVTMDFWGANADGTEIPQTRSQSYRAILGSKTLIPGFEDALVGLQKGGEKTFTLTFPEKSEAKDLRGKPVTFHVTVQNVEEVHQPVLDDAFAKTHLHASSAKEFRDTIRSSMVAQEEQIDRQRREQLLLEEIRKATVIDLAPELIADETRSLLAETQRQLAEAKTTMEQWLKKRGKTAEQFQAEIASRAEQRLTLRFAVQELIAQRQISVTEEEVRKAADDLLAPLPPDERRSVKAAYEPGQNAYEQLKWQKTVEKLLDQFLSA